MNPEYFFPLSNIRKLPNGSWSLLNIIENRKVPDSQPYYIRLKEIPDDGTIISSPFISGSLSGANPIIFTEVTSSPGPGQFLVKYNSGKVYFNDQNKNYDIEINYFGKGSAIDADDLNYIKSLVDSNYHYSSQSNKLINGTQNLPPSGNVEISHGLGTKDILVQVQFKSQEYNYKWVNARAVLSFKIIDDQKIEIYNDSNIIINKENWRVFLSIFNIPVFYNQSEISTNSWLDINHGLGTENILFQIQWKPISGENADKWIDGESILSCSIIDENTIRIFNNGSINIPINRCKLFISIF